MKPTLSLAAALLLVAIYSGSYFLLRTDERQGHMVVMKRGPDGKAYSVLAEDYKFGGSVAKAIFKPANWIDRKARPYRWLSD